MPNSGSGRGTSVGPRKQHPIYNPDFAHYLALAPWPYADMYESLKPFIVEKDYRKYNLIDPVIKPEHMTVEEIDKAIINYYQNFYMGKMTEIMTMKDEFKKDYLLRSMRLIMSSSFIVTKLGALGSVPPQVEALIKKLEKPAKAEEKSSDFVPLATKPAAIEAPLEKVFALVSDPANWPAYITGLKEVKNFSASAVKTGAEFGWTYSIKGIDSGTGKVVEYERNSKLALQMHSLMPLRKTISFKSDHENTMLTVDVGHKAPGKALSFLFNLVRTSLNIMETTAVLERIKTLCETAGDSEQRTLRKKIFVA